MKFKKILFLYLNTLIRCGYSDMNCTAPVVPPAEDVCKECSATGYTYETQVHIGFPLEKLENKSWLDCTAECDQNSKCDSFAYHAEKRNCFLKSSRLSPPHPSTSLYPRDFATYKEGFVYSRSCGRSGLDCQSKACESCAETGYTSERYFYNGMPLKSVNGVTLNECAAECDKVLLCLALG